MRKSLTIPILILRGIIISLSVMHQEYRVFDIWCHFRHYFEHNLRGKGSTKMLRCIKILVSAGFILIKRKKTMRLFVISAGKITYLKHVGHIYCYEWWYNHSTTRRSMTGFSLSGRSTSIFFFLLILSHYTQRDIASKYSHYVNKDLTNK